MLKSTFQQLLQSYSVQTENIEVLWNEIEVAYSRKKRHYHTLHHLENLLLQLEEVKNRIENWNTILFTLYYHDIVYNPIKHDNEEQSAELAELRMESIAIPNSIIENCRQQILATKKHLPDVNVDTNYFTDADLSVLGQDWNTYSEYYKKVRKEYSIFPDLIYVPGRKKVLAHFLQMERIFKTEHFYVKYENQAKQNLQQELNLL